MKKFVGALLCFVMIFSMFASVFASDISLLDIENDIMELQGGATPGEKVSILVVNPGFTKADAVAGKDGAIQYFATYVPEKEDYTFSFQVTGAVGGDFKAYIGTKTGEEEIPFTFYTSVYKKKCIKDINDADASGDVTGVYEALVEAFGLNENELYKELEAKDAASALMLIRDTLDGKIIPENVTDVDLLLRQSFVLAAFNAAKSDIIFSDGKFGFSKEIAVDGSDEYNDYENSLSDKGRENVNSALVSKTYKNIGEITEMFKDSVYFNVIMNYKKSGYGHIQYYFEKYESAYEDAGIDIPNKENRTLYQKLLNSKTKNLEELAEAFEDLSKSASKPSGGSSSGLTPSSPGKGSYGGGAAVVPSTKPSETPTEAKSFGDVSAEHWGYKAISTLAEKGYLSGYEDGSFKPSGNITRAEFTKIIISAFKVEKSEGESFEDVKADAWYAPFVASAVKAGIVLGNGTSFNPDGYLTREDAAVMICRALGADSDGRLYKQNAR